MKVMHVVLSLDCGGLERIVLSLVREGQRLGQDVSVLCLERPGTLAAQAEQLGAKVISLGKSQGLVLSLIQQIRDVLGHVRPQVVHTHQISALFYAGPAARSLNIPAVVHTEHGKTYSTRKRTRWVGRMAGPFASRFLCVSRDIADEVLRYAIAPRHKVQVVANGIEPAVQACHGATQEVRQSLGIPRGAPLVGTVGRLHEIKCHWLLIRAFARLLPRIPDAQLQIVGDGPCMPKLRALTSELRIGNVVHLVGYQPDPHSYLRAMDVFALTSCSEGMPVSILEAFRARVPVVASRVGGVCELIEHGRTGMLFESGDEMALTAQLEEVLNDKQLSQRLAKAGHDLLMAQFDSSAMARNYQRHYLHAMARTSNRGTCSKAS